MTSLDLQITFWMVVLGALSYTFALIIEHFFGHNHQIKRRLLERSSTENHQFLRTHLRLKKFPPLVVFILYIIPALSFLVLPYVRFGVNIWWEVSLFLMALANVSMLTFSTLYACTFWMNSEEKKKELRISNFLTKEQLNFLMKKADGTRKLERFLRYEKEVYSPDMLIELLKKKEEMNTLIELSDSYDELNKKVLSFNEEQQVRKTNLQVRLSKGCHSLSPHVKELVDATVLFKKKTNSEKEETKHQKPVEENESFNQIEKEMLVKLNTLEKPSDSVAKKDEPIRELEQILLTTNLSEEVRKEASTLLKEILKLKDEEELIRKRKADEMNARSVIQASRLLYGISEEEVGRT